MKLRFWRRTPRVVKGLEKSEMEGKEEEIEQIALELEDLLSILSTMRKAVRTASSDLSQAFKDGDATEIEKREEELKTAKGNIEKGESNFKDLKREARRRFPDAFHFL